MGVDQISQAEMIKMELLVASADKLDVELQQTIDMHSNQILNVLTVLSAVFVPPNFLAATWGMNFEDMPELHWKEGYAMYWAATGIMWAGCAVVWCYLRRDM